MRGSILSTALIATVSAQGVTQVIAPTGRTPAECQANADGRWELSVEAIVAAAPAPAVSSPPSPVVVASPVASSAPTSSPTLPPSSAPLIVVSSAPSNASATIVPSSALSTPLVVPTVPVGTVPGMPIAPILKRAEPIKNTLLVTLTNGILKDRYNRVGYIAANRQFQFDGPPQAGALFTGGWSLCNNGTLALGPSAIFYRCLSGDFYNLYDQRWATHCSGVYIHAIKARTEVVNEVPPLPPNAPPPPPPGPTPVSSPATNSSAALSTTPVIIVPPASTTITTNPSAASSVSSLSSLASSASSVASSASSAASSGSASVVVTSVSSATGSVIQAAGTTIPVPAPPVDASQASSGNVNHLSIVAAVSMGLALGAFALLM